MSDSEETEKGPGAGRSEDSSRATTASSVASSKSAKSRISKQEAERLTSAAAVVAALSRPTSQKSGAWSKDPEAGHEAQDKEIKAAKLKKKKDELEAILEEELDDDGGQFKGAEPVGCWKSFTQALSSIWSTSDLLTGEETEERVRTTTRELSVYILFLVILSWVTSSATNKTMFDYTNTMKSLFELQADVRQVTDFWYFMENDFLDAVYWEEWYNEGSNPKKLPCSHEAAQSGSKGPCPIQPKDRMIMYSNKLLGVPRMRLLRVTNMSCLIPEDFQERIKVCYDNYDRSIEDKTDFYPSSIQYTSADAWRYQSVKELDGHDVTANLATYSGAGSVQDLTHDRQATKMILRELKEGLWIKRGTRYVAVDFTLYNANINYFSVITLHFEFPPTGGILSTGEFTTVKLLRYITQSDYALMGAEGIFVIMVFYYLVEEVMEIIKNKFEYFMSFWNILDICVITVSVATIAFNIYKYLAVNNLLKGLLAEPDLYADFAFLAKWSRTFQYAAGLAIFMAYVKIFKYISFNKTMAQLSGTITRSLPDLGGFMMMFLIVFCAFAQIAYLMFGPYVEDFSTFINTVYTQFRLILGDFVFANIEKAHPLWGPVYFLAYVFFVFFILMNMFMAILNDTYSEVKEEVENRKEDFQMLDFLKRGYNNVREIVSERDKLLDIQTTIKLAADDGVVTFDEIRGNLRKLNFSDAEIEIFCSKYDADGNFEFNLEEINAIENGIEMEIENEQKIIESRRPSMATNAGGNDELLAPPNQGMLNGLQARVDRMELIMKTIASKVNDVLTKLESFEDNSRKLSAKVRQISSAQMSEDDKKRQVEELVQENLNE